MTVTKTTGSRWAKAQTYEKSWWDTRKDLIDLEFYQYHAAELIADLDGVLAIDADTRILEVGSGAAGILTHLPGRRHAIDPLEEFYAKVERFAEYRDPDVTYHAGRGEELPFESASFDLVIMDNVLDHCEDTAQVLVEAKRVLRRGGIVYFRQNIYTRWGKMVRGTMEVFEIDRGHPHTFTDGDLLRLFARHRLAILRTKSRGYVKTWLRELGSGNRKTLVRALLFAVRTKKLYVLSNYEL